MELLKVKCEMALHSKYNIVEEKFARQLDF